MTSNFGDTNISDFCVSYTQRCADAYTKPIGILVLFLFYSSRIDKSMMCLPLMGVRDECGVGPVPVCRRRAPRPACVGPGAVRRQASRGSSSARRPSSGTSRRRWPGPGTAARSGTDRARPASPHGPPPLAGLPHRHTVSAAATAARTGSWHRSRVHRQTMIKWTLGKYTIISSLMHTGYCTHR